MTLASSKDHALPIQAETMAALLAGSVSATLLLGAFVSQYVGGLAPCEMCIWQRWPHGASILFGFIGGWLVMNRVLPAQLAKPLAILAIAGLAISGAIGVFHAGVEWKFWPGPAECTGFGYVPGRDDFKPLQIVRCDEAQWRLLGISLAGYNALFSLAAAAMAASLLGRKRT
ncbi:MAG TPA: disulfide bond formation protein B [Micropepsaceae bacterium]|nr:disulfide bond formation protein B [Micropepsaceae bacterium]